MAQFSSVRSLSCVQLFATPWIAARQASLSIINSRSLLKHMSIELVMASSHLILCRSLLFLPPTPPSVRVSSNESTLCMRWPKYWSFSFSIWRHAFSWETEDTIFATFLPPVAAKDFDFLWLTLEVNFLGLMRATSSLVEYVVSFWLSHKKNLLVWVFVWNYVRSYFSVARQWIL